MPAPQKRTRRSRLDGSRACQNSAVGEFRLLNGNEPNFLTPTVRNLLRMPSTPSKPLQTDFYCLLPQLPEIFANLTDSFQTLQTAPNRHIQYYCSYYLTPTARNIRKSFQTLQTAPNRSILYLVSTIRPNGSKPPQYAFQTLQTAPNRPVLYLPCNPNFLLS